MVAVSLPSCGPLTTIPVTNETSEFDNFVCDSGQIVWQFVYNTEDIPAAKDFIRTHFAVKSETDNRSICESFKDVIPFEAVGYTYTDVPLVMQHPCTEYFVVDWKEDKYRVTITNVIWDAKVGLSMYGAMVTGVTINLQEVAFKYGEISSTFYNKTAPILNKIFMNQFAPKKQIPNNNW